MLNIAQKKIEIEIGSDDFVLYEDQLINYFGETYASDPANFRFEIGDRKLIKILSNHVKNQAEEHGAKYLRRFRKKIVSANKKSIQFDHRRNIDENTSANTAASTAALSLMDDNSNVDCQELSVQLVRRLKQFLEQFNIEKSVIQMVNQSTVQVKIVDGTVHAEAFCIICQNNGTIKGKLKAKRVYYKNGESSKYWVLSNYNTHLKNVHKLQPRTQSSNESLINSDDHEFIDNGLGKKNESSLNSVVNANCVPMNTVINQTSRDSTVATTEQHQVEVDEFLKIEPMPLANNFIPYLETNNQKVVFEQISVQITKMLEATLSHNENPMKMYFKLFEGNFNSLEVIEMDPDGSCLFYSLTHQLFGCKANSPEHKRKSRKLRKDVIQYITMHYSSFKFSLQGRVYDTVNPKQITDMDAECRFILNDCLCQTHFYGGSETLKAVHEMYHVNILIFNEESDCSFVNQFIEKNERTLILAHRLNRNRQEDEDFNNHYDTVCDISSNEILKSIEFMVQTLHKKEAMINFNETL